MWEGFVERLWGWGRSSLKWLLHAWFGTCELERVCEGKRPHSKHMSQRFTSLLHRSKRLRTWSNIIFHHHSFNTRSASDFILKTKQIDAAAKPYTAANVNLCLRDLRIINIAASKLEATKKRTFDPTSKEHVSLLEQLWKSLMTDSLFPGLQSQDWGLVGFQGNDPSTDFRGMGVLGLQQLAWFCANDTKAASSVLSVSLHERRYFPFSATSIVFTSLVCDLLHEQRLHHLLIATLADSALAPPAPFSSSTAPATAGVDEVSAEEKRQAAQLLERLHRLHAELYAEFSSLWVERDPQSVMDFGRIFGEFKMRVHARLPPLPRP